MEKRNSTWVTRSLESIASVERGKFSARPRNDPKYFKGGAIPFIQTGDVASANRFVDAASQFLNAEGLQVSKCFPPGTIFVTIAANIGDVAISRIPVACPDSLVGVTANPDVCDGVWLYYSLSSSKDYFESKATQNAQKNINLQVLKPFLLALPSLSEQKKIAAILTAVDDKLDVIACQIEATKTLKQGLMQTLFSRGVGTQDVDERWEPHIEVGARPIRGEPANWKEYRLGDIAPLVRRPVDIALDESYPELGLRSYGKGTFHKPALLGSEVGNKRLFQIKAGDLLFSNVFAWEGAVAVAKPEDDGRFGSHRYITCVVDSTRADTSFVFRFLTTPAGIALLTLASPGGAGRNKTLGLTALANIAILLPPLAEQRKISEILDGVDAKLDALTAKQSHYQRLKRGLMQKLLTGDWPVRVGALNEARAD
jgi:type I restriction enzyme S subunit